MAAGENAALVLPFSADIRLLEAQLNRATNALNRSMDTMEARAAHAETQIASHLGRGNIGKALDNVFDRSRLAVLEAGTTKLPLFGSALEAIGPAGLAAAAGIAAVGFAIEKAVAAGEWAESLERAARTLGISTTALQEFDFVASAAGIPVERMRESLKGLAAVVGQVQAGVARGQTKKVFAAILGVEPDQVGAVVRQLGGVDNALRTIVERLASLPATERVGLAQRLRIDPEVLQSLADAKGGVDGLIARAHAAGAILDEDLVRKGAEAAGTMRELKTTIGDELRGAFLELTPEVAAAATALASAAQNLADFVRGVGDALGPVAQLIGLLDKFPHAPAGVGASSTGIPALDLLLQLGGAVSAKGKLDRQQAAQLDALHEQIVKEFGPQAAPAPKLLDDAPKKKKKTHDDTDEKIKEIGDQLAEAGKRAIEAEAALTKNVQAHADIERRAVGTELAKQEADRAATVEKINADKALTKAVRQRLLTELYLASLADQNAAAAKVAKINRDAAFAIEDSQIATHKAVAESKIAELESQRAISRSTDERARLAREILRLQQQLETDIRTTELDRQFGLGEITKDQHDAQVGALQRSQAAATATSNAANAGVFGDALRALPDFKTALEDDGVHAIHSLSDAVVQSSENLRDAGRIFKRFVAGILEDLLRLSLQQGLEKPLLQGLGKVFGGLGTAGPEAAASAGLVQVAASATAAAAALTAVAASGAASAAGSIAGDAGSAAFIGLPPFAAGTDNAPGGWARINERGTEGVAFLPPGTKVIPNDTLKALSRGIPTVGRAGDTHLNIAVDAGGAITEETIRGMVAQGVQIGMRVAVSQAVQQSRGNLFRDVNKDRLLRG